MMAISNFADWVAPTASPTNEVSSEAGTTTQAEQDFAALLAASYAGATMPVAPSPVAAPPAEITGHATEVSATMLTAPTDILATKAQAQELVQFPSTKLPATTVEPTATNIGNIIETLSEQKLQQQMPAPSNTVAEVAMQSSNAIPSTTSTDIRKESLLPAPDVVTQPEPAKNMAQPALSVASTPNEIANTQAPKLSEAIASSSPQATAELKTTAPNSTASSLTSQQANNNPAAEQVAPTTSAVENPAPPFTVAVSTKPKDSVHALVEQQPSSKLPLEGNATPFKMAVAIVKTIVSEPYVNPIPLKEPALHLNEVDKATSFTTESSASEATVAPSLQPEAAEVTPVAAAMILPTLKAVQPHIATDLQPEGTAEPSLPVQSPTFVTENGTVKSLPASLPLLVKELVPQTGAIIQDASQPIATKPTPQMIGSTSASSEQAVTKQPAVGTSFDAFLATIPNQELSPPAPSTQPMTYDAGLILQSEFLQHETPDQIITENFNAVTATPLAGTNQPLNSPVNADVGTPTQQAVIQQTTQPLVEFAHSVPHRETQTLRLSLNPVELGRVNIEVTRDGEGRVHASFTVEQADTAQALTHNIGHLRESLERAGLTVEQLQVTSQSQPQTSSQLGQSGQQPGQHQPAPQPHMTHGNTPLTDSSVSGNPTSATDNKLLSMHA